MIPRWVSITVCISLLPFAVQALDPHIRLSLPAPYLSVSFYPTGALDEVFITYDQSMQGYAITDFNDRYVKITPRLRTDFNHREMAQFARCISDFEAEHLSRVCEGLERTLQILDRDIQQQRWQRLEHLDAKFAKFLRGFYWLASAARCSRTALPPECELPDSLWNFDADTTRPERRIAAWHADQERCVKIRIAARELIYQSKAWRKKVLNNKKRDPFDRQNEIFAEAYGLFIGQYFGMEIKNQPRNLLR